VVGGGVAGPPGNAEGGTSIALFVEGTGAGAGSGVGVTTGGDVTTGTSAGFLFALKYEKTAAADAPAIATIKPPTRTHTTGEVCRDGASLWRTAASVRGIGSTACWRPSVSTAAAAVDCARTG
jgi:hypothetical protein